MSDCVKFYGREWERRQGMVYAATRAVSNVVNLNYDAWPSDELEAAYKTFRGRPVFLDHESADLDGARGLILDSEFLRDGDAAWVELLIEIDAETYPEIGREVATGGIDSVSMGAIVEWTECSICGARIESPAGACEHVKYRKGAMWDGRLVYELCHDITFYEVSLVFDPADASATIRTVEASSMGEWEQTWTPVDLSPRGVGGDPVDVPGLSDEYEPGMSGLNGGVFPQYGIGEDEWPAVEFVEDRDGGWEPVITSGDGDDGDEEDVFGGDEGDVFGVEDALL